MPILLAIFFEERTVAARCPSQFCENTVVDWLWWQQCATRRGAGQMLLCGAGVSISSSPSPSVGYMSAIVNLLPNDAVSDQINNDSLLTRYGQILFSKLGLEWTADVRCHLRYLARLKIQLSVTGGYEAIIKGQHFDAVLAATKELCSISEQRTLNRCLKLEKQHVALKVGQFLRKITQVRNFSKTLS